MATPTASSAPDLSALSQAGSAQQQPDAAQDTQAAPEQNSSDDSTQAPQAPDSGNDSVGADESAAEGSINIQRAFSALNSALTKLLDENGVKRSFTVPYVDGQPMADHIKSVGAAAAQAGGLGNNLLTTSHHADGRGYGSGDGHTVAHPVEKLRNTVIPKGDENAKAAIQACRSLLNKISKLIGEDEPAVKTAKSQLNLVASNDGVGMTLMDFSIVLIQLVSSPLQAVARAYSATHEGGAAVQLRGPHARTAPAVAPNSSDVSAPNTPTPQA